MTAHIYSNCLQTTEYFPFSFKLRATESQVQCLFNQRAKDWPRFNLALGVPKLESTLRTDAWEVLPRLSAAALKHVAAVFVTPRQLEAGHG